MGELREICQQVCEVAMEAGDYIGISMMSFSSDKVEYKSPNNVVSFVDKEAERMIIEGLMKIVPEAKVLGEESTHPSDETLKEWVEGDEYIWIIDPIDGTKNFVHGMPPFCVSIALAKGREIIVGVVYEVTGDECFYAWKDSPAFLNGREISVSKIDRMSESMVMAGLAYSSNYDGSDFNRLFDYFNTHSHGLRRSGSATANLVYVAAGRGEAFFQAGLHPWDVAAGALIVQRAGGRVSEYDLGEDYVYGRTILASNGILHEEVQQVVYRG